MKKYLLTPVMAALLLTLTPAAFAQKVDLVSSNGGEITKSHPFERFLKTFFSVYGGYESLNAALKKEQNGKTTRGFLSVQGSLANLIRDGEAPAAEGDLGLIPFEVKVTSDKHYAVRFAAMDSRVRLSGSTNDNDGSVDLKMQLAEFQFDETLPWGTVKKIEVARVTPVFSEGGNKVNFSLGLPIETGGIWTHITDFNVEGSPEMVHDRLDLYTWQFQVYVAAKIDARISKSSRVGALFQIAAFTSAPTKLNDYSSDGAFVDTRSQNIQSQYYANTLKNATGEAFYGFSVGQSKKTEIQLVVKAVIPVKSDSGISGSSFHGAKNTTPVVYPDQYSKEYWTADQGWRNAWIGPIPAPPTNVHGEFYPSSYDGKKVVIPNPFFLQIGVRVKF